MIRGAFTAPLLALTAGACATDGGTLDEPPFPGERVAGTLTGASVAADVGDPDGSGDFVLWFDEEAPRVCWQIDTTGIGEVTAAHIHRGAPGEGGAIVLPLEGDDNCRASEAALLNEILDLPQNFFVQVHTAEYPAGALRGQLPPGGHGAGG